MSQPIDSDALRVQIEAIIDERLYPVDNASKRKIILSLVWVLAGLAAISIIGTIVLAGMGEDLAVVSSLATLIIGGLIGLFAPSPTGS
ncbi:hypothetical protein CH278_24620 [Rhodococcus sp. 05-2254-5]|uniref:hypothetical protein n=1 Tax=unclassified Rhodococcus (in: high G+C Gram-positive bacteria) TaxID=192944 RepID=UPI000B9A4C80|nr:MULTISPECIES: hypothetical protein [unclassified Rhodococcus (in: high G+C Gram-positive bacteria)]OZE28109.1 hypothetical protein CH278_24620 [Rhodococcus sp. 05-2254-5]OZE52472.1 hypothetical protein CH269_23535 [Rhodococcus sp. 05-2254-1]